MENLLWGLLDGIIGWPTLIVNVFGGDYQVFQTAAATAGMPWLPCSGVLAAARYVRQQQC
jgi:hypothetical protein